MQPAANQHTTRSQNRRSCQTPKKKLK